MVTAGELGVSSKAEDTLAMKKQDGRYRVEWTSCGEALMNDGLMRYSHYAGAMKSMTNC